MAGLVGGRGESAMAKARIVLEEVACHFHELEDPRSSVNRRHPLVSVVVIALMGALAGANGPTSIAEWAGHKAEFLMRSLDLPHGVPGKDVFRRVLCLLEPAAFQACFANWLAALRADAAREAGDGQPILAIDGKTLRRSHDQAKGLGALHSVSVWASELGLSLGEVACDGKSNEITAIPELLEQVDVSGAIVTIDAMGCQKEIAAKIVDEQADYVLALKGNQETLHNAVIEHIDRRAAEDFSNATVRSHTTEEKGHGRLETRSYFQLPAPKDLPGADRWKGLKTIGLVVAARVENGRETVESRYFISSLPLGVKQFARAVRSHWAIENACHWSLDMTFREDESRIRERRLGENFAWLNRFSLSKQHPGRQSLAMKRRICGWQEKFLLEVLLAAKT
jgi:predicted transposase YbfD/YdcC